MLEVEDDFNIPTCVTYEKNNNVLIGKSARNKKNYLTIAENFKLDIGNSATNNHTGDQKIDFGNCKKSPMQISSDFFREVFKKIKVWLENNNLSTTPNLLIAEPLSLQSQSGIVTKDWLKSYRKNIKNLLSGQFFNLANISFMPEPFAVFQYYRYGYKHPLLSSNKKHNVLVIDFGGGTFDVCVISTTQKGDVRIAGKHSKPLAAASEPIGGYFINKVLAESLLFEYCDNKSTKTKIRKGIGLYNRWKRNESGFDISTIKNEFQTFIKKFDYLIYDIEEYKINLSNFITDWNLETELESAISINIPKSMFSDDDNFINARLTAVSFRQIFIQEVWNSKLKNVIQKTIERAKNELKNEEISLVLLSGGSSNIKWINKLFKKDFSHELNTVEIFDLPDYQEVVSKGLAIECAKRFYNEEKEGDFSSVTYNRICLLLAPNDFPCEPKVFKPKTKDLPVSTNEPAVLLPSSYIAKNNLNKELFWKVKINKRPTSKLNYYFLRSTLDYNDTNNLFNIQEHRVFPPHKCKFDSYLTISLRINNDGIATPKFIFKTDQGDNIVSSTTGLSFPIDITTTQENPSSSYIGFDFGSSNSSVSYIDQKHINVFEERSSNENWQDLSTIVDKILYPISAPLAHYLCQTDQDKKILNAIKFTENTLSFLAYITYLEVCSNLRKNSKIFKGFTQRSAGPLWALLQETLKKLPQSSIFSEEFKALVENNNFKDINLFIDNIAQYKHSKIDSKTINTDTPVQILSNLCAAFFEHCYFGYFEEVKKKRFSHNYSGKFRIAHGKQPFTRTLQYSGNEEFSEEVAVLYHRKSQKLINLEPLIFWDYCHKHTELHNGHCYFFDKMTQDTASYTAINYPCNLQVTNDNNYAKIYDFLLQMNKQDIQHQIRTIPLNE